MEFLVKSILSIVGGGYQDGSVTVCIYSARWQHIL